MRALVVYESLYGNTQRIANAIADGLRARADVEVREVSEAPDPTGVDLLIVGGPTHMWGMSRERSRADGRDRAPRAYIGPPAGAIGVREWLERLPPGDFAVAAFDTAADTRWSGSAARRIARKLVARGHRLVASPAQFRVRGTSGPLLDGEVARATAWGAALRVEPVRRAPRRERAIHWGRYVVSLAGAAAMLAVVHAHPVWRPWLGGFVTARWADVLWALDLSLGAQLVTYGVLLATRERWLRTVAEVVDSAGAFLVLSALNAVYPFAFAAPAGPLADLVRAGLAFALLAATIGLVVNVARLAVAPGGGEPVSH